MRVTVKHLKSKYRIVESQTGKVLSRANTDYDGGGYVIPGHAHRLKNMINNYLTKFGRLPDLDDLKKANAKPGTKPESESEPEDEGIATDDLVEDLEPEPEPEIEKAPTQSAKPKPKSKNTPAKKKRAKNVKKT